mgnify:CR=1 FL=1
MPLYSTKATPSIKASEDRSSEANSQCHQEQQSHPTIIVVAPDLELPALRPEAATVTIQLEATANPLATITEALKERRQQGTPAKELHLLAHGNSQGIQLADQWIDQAALLRHASELAHWQISTVVLWCCQIGRNQDFIDLFKEVTGAEVFASQNSINKEAIQTSNQDGDTRQLSELIENSQLHTWQGDLEWIQIDDAIVRTTLGRRQLPAANVVNGHLVRLRPPVERTTDQQVNLFHCAVATDCQIACRRHCRYPHAPLALCRDVAVSRSQNLPKPRHAPPLAMEEQHVGHLDHLAAAVGILLFAGFVVYFFLF